MVNGGDVTVTGAILMAGWGILRGLKEVAAVLGPVAKSLTEWSARIEANTETAAAAATDVAEIRARLEERHVIPIRREKGATA